MVASTRGSASSSPSGARGVARDLVRLRYEDPAESDAGATEVIADGNRGVTGPPLTGGIPDMLPSEPNYDISVAIAMVNSIGALAQVTLADKFDDAQLRDWVAGLS